MKPHLPGLLLLSIIVAGCTSKQPVSPGEEVRRPPKVTEEPGVISTEAFSKIPKNLRPEELEQRDDTTVVIRSGDNRTLKEYRIGGFLYAIQVIPKVGKPYFLVAADNQGNFIRTDKPGMLVPSWTIFEWK